LKVYGIEYFRIFGAYEERKGEGGKEEGAE